MLSQTTLNAKPNITETEFLEKIVSVQNTESIGPIALNLLTQFALTDEQIAILARDKDYISNYIISLNTEYLLEKCLEPTEQLGKLMWYQRGLVTPTTFNGCLSLIVDAYHPKKTILPQGKLMHMPANLQESKDKKLVFFNKMDNYYEERCLDYSPDYFKLLINKLDRFDKDIILNLLNDSNHTPEAICTREKFMAYYGYENNILVFISDYFTLLKKLLFKNANQEVLSKLIKDFLTYFRDHNANYIALAKYKDLYISYLDLIYELPDYQVKSVPARNGKGISDPVFWEIPFNLTMTLQLGARSSEILFKVLRNEQLEADSWQKLTGYRNGVYQHITSIPDDEERYHALQLALDPMTQLGKYFHYKASPANTLLANLNKLKTELTVKLNPNFNNETHTQLFQTQPNFGLVVAPNSFGENIEVKSAPLVIVESIAKSKPKNYLPTVFKPKVEVKEAEAEEKKTEIKKQKQVILS